MLAVAALTASLGLSPVGVLADELLVPTDYPTIQMALDASAPGDEVVLLAGVYGGAGNEALAMPGFDITLRGQSGDPADVVLERAPTSGLARAMTIPAGAAGTRVADLTVRNFRQSDGAAIRVVGSGPGSDVEFDNCVVVNNRVLPSGCDSDGHGGGFYITDAQVRFIDCQIRDNIAQAGACSGFGGLGQGGGVWAQNSDLHFEGCLIAANGVLGSEFYTTSGAGVYAPGSTVTLIDSVVRDNQANSGSSRGAGVIAGTLVAVGTDFLGNWAAADLGGSAKGGAILATEATIINARIEGNLAGYGESGFLGQGGGVYTDGAVTMANVVLLNNRGEGFGDSDQVAGGGLYAAGGGKLTNVTIKGNEAWGGPGIYAAGGLLEMFNCVVSNDFYWLETAGGASVQAVYSCFDLAGTSLPGSGNIWEFPLLDADGRPTAGSPVIDAGNSTLLPDDTYDLDGDGITAETIPFDAAGNRRRVDDTTTPDTGVGWPVVDMGAYEFEDPCRADLDGDGRLTVFDFLEFTNLFAARDRRADFDGDGRLTVFDFLEFQTEFARGCR